MGWKTPKQSSLLISLSPASQYCSVIVQIFTACFSKYQHCWNDWEIHCCDQQRQELRSGALNPLQQMQVFWYSALTEMNESERSSSVPPLLPNLDVGLESWWLQQTALHARKSTALGCLLASLAAVTAAAVDEARVCVCVGSCYLPAASVLTLNTIASPRFAMSYLLDFPWWE